MITKFINEIRIFNSYDYIENKTVKDVCIKGDGQGDFEEIHTNATKECFLKYIEHCKEQIETANKCIKHFYG